MSYVKEMKKNFTSLEVQELITGKPHTYVMDGYVMRVNLDTGQFYISTV